MRKVTTFRPNDMVGGLRVEREIGRGAYGTVYLARDELIRRQVALKVVTRDEKDERSDRTLLEARAVGRLHSPNIVALHGLHPLEADAGWILEFEYMDGGSLKEWLDRETRLPPDRALEVAVDVLRGLAAAHEAGVVHGDVKPANVLLDTSGRAALTDFGLARFYTEESLTESISAGPAGTPSYMAPEVIMGQKAHFGSDLWSVGIVLYRSLCGRLPFPADTFHQLFLAVQNQEPVPLPHSIPSAVADFTMQLLRKDSAERPATATAALQLLSPVETAAAPARAPAERAAPRPKTSLLGREHELAQLHDALSELMRGKGSTVLISGEAGMGKSALVRSMHAVATTQKGARWVEATVTPLDGLLRPLLRAARYALDTKMAQLERILADEDSAVSASMVRNLLTDNADANVTSPQQIAWSLEKLFLALSRESPLVVVIEDAHRADPEDMRLLRELAERLPRGRVMLLITLRTQSLDASQSEASATSAFHELSALPALRHVDLAPLSRDAIYQLLERNTTAERVSPDVAQRIVETVEGNPLHAEEMMRHLEEIGVVFLDGSVVRARPQWEQSRLPQRFHELVAARLAGLPMDLRHLIDAAAVDGRSFDAESIAAITNRPPLETLRDLQRLYRERNLIEPDGEAYRFTSTVVQRVIYEDLAPALRRAIHAALAHHLEARSEDVAPQRIGQHWELGGQPKKAAPYLIEAGIAAAQRQEANRAIQLFERAGLGPETLALDDAYVHSEALFHFADCCYVRGLHERTTTIYSLIDAAAKEGDDDELYHRCVVRRAHVERTLRGPDAISTEALQAAIAALPRSREAADAHFILGAIARLKGRMKEASDSLHTAEQMYVRLEEHARRPHVLNQLASIAKRALDFDAAESWYREVSRISYGLGRRINGAIGEVNAADIAFARGDLEQLPETLERAIQVLSLEGSVKHAAHVAAHLAHVYFALGDVNGCEESADRALRLLGDLPYLPVRVDALGEKSICAIYRAHLDAAHLWLSQANAEAEQQGNASARASIAALTALANSCAGHPDKARAAAARALAFAEGDDEALRDVHLLLAEALAFGLPTACLAQVDNGDELSNAIYAAFAEPTVEHNAMAAGLLERYARGGRRESTRALAALFRARAGEPGIEQGIERAESLGHSWLHASLLKQSGQADALTKIIESICENSTQDAPAIRNHWL